VGKICLILLVVLVLGLSLYAPLYYDFWYHGSSHDPAYRIGELDTITEDVSILSGMWYYAPAILLPFTLLGSSPFGTYTLFQYLVVVGVVITIFLFVKKYYGNLPAFLAGFFLILVGCGLCFYHRGGAAYHLFSLYIVAPILFCFLLNYLEKGTYRRFLPIPLLLLILTFLHSLTYIYLLGGLGLFLLGYLILKKSERALFSLLLLLFTIPLAWFTWGVHSFREALVYPPAYEAISSSIKDITIWPILLYTLVPFMLCIFTLPLLYKLKFNKIPLLLLCAFLPALIIGTFTHLGVNNWRVALDLGIFLTLTSGIGLGIALPHISFKKSYHSFSILCIVLIVTISTPLGGMWWVEDYSILREVDKEAIKFIEGAEEVLLPPQIEPEIYQLYSDVSFTRMGTKVPDTFDEYDYVIYRSDYLNPLPGGNPPTPRYDLEFEKDLTEVAVFPGKVEVKVYSSRPR